ncbi:MULTISPECIES: hypothetical protein [Paenibacillus]|uniref:Lipoprotein n=1 Tax=Paenibacillus amylolyticus TaxID=1451 RepID=A0ABD8B207_PAEAM|nr:hypothetical protein [Paenibacillus sp. GM1FR]PJN59843.1 hypothetical protein PAEAM_28780 [Paenibacillus sp. GM1FR]
MRRKLSLVICLTFLLIVLGACGNGDIKHVKSEHWDVAFQRSTGSFGITYIGDETQINDLVYGVTGTNIDQEGKAYATQETPFKISGLVTDSEKTKDPIIFKIDWNNKSESVTFE